MNSNKYINEKSELLKIAYSTDASKRVRKRVLAVNMHLNGVDERIIAKILGICDKSVKNYIKRYFEKGLLDLIQEKNYKPESEMEKYSTEIVESLEKEPCISIKECCSRIEKITGLKRSTTQVSKFIKKKGFKLLKTGQVPSKADPEKQKIFLANELEPRLNEAKKEKRKVYFVDAAHFVMGSYLIQLWCIVRMFIKTSSGRQRYNVLGAIDIFHNELIKITNEAYINSDVVCKLIQKIHAIHGTKKIPLTLVMDNARYQRCKKVTNYANELGIEILFLPTYSPNLNLIERLWKFVKKKALYAKYYEKFSIFKEAIDKCLDGIDKEYSEEISSLLTPNFQTFEIEKPKVKTSKIA